MYIYDLIFASIFAVVLNLIVCVASFIGLIRLFRTQLGKILFSASFTRLWFKHWNKMFKGATFYLLLCLLIGCARNLIFNLDYSQFDQCAFFFTLWTLTDTEKYWIMKELFPFSEVQLQSGLPWDISWFSIGNTTYLPPPYIFQARVSPKN